MVNGPEDQPRSVMQAILPTPSNSAPLQIPFIHGPERLAVTGQEVEDLINNTELHPFEAAITQLEDLLSEGQLALHQQAALVQKRFFFGLFREISGFNLNLSRSLTDDDPCTGRRYVVLEKEAFATWLDYLQDRYTQSEADRIKSLLQLANYALDLIEEQNQLKEDRRLPADSGLDVLAPIVLSSRLLVNYFHLVIQLCQSQPLGKLNLRKAMKSYPKIDSKVPQPPYSGPTQPLCSYAERPRNISLAPEGMLSLATELLLTQFAASGWCPARARLICQSYDYVTSNFLSVLQCRNGQTDIHESCMASYKCSAYNIDENNYTTQHAGLFHDSIEECPDSKDIQNQLQDIIRRGRIPLVCVDPKDDRDYDLHLVEADGNTPYVAISHVWSDGLGNPKTNSLPMCQIEQLIDLLQTLRKFTHKTPTKWHQRFLTSWRILEPCLGPRRKKKLRQLHFWIDTMCIPVGNESLRAKAIDHIAAIFLAAQHVLILDKDLESVSLRPDQLTTDNCEMSEELAGQVLAGKWFSRAWTMEEGCLAQECYFNFGRQKLGRLGAARFVPMPGSFRDNLRYEGLQIRRKFNWPKSKSVGSGGGPGLVTSILYDLLNDVRKRSLGPYAGREEQERFVATRSQHFVHAWNGLLERAATRENDTPKILAHIMDIQVGTDSLTPLLPVIVHSFERLPMSLMFNTQAVVAAERDLRDAWVPIKVNGDPLVDGPVLGRMVSLDNGLCARKLDQSQRSSVSLTFLLTDTPIPKQHRGLRILFREDNGSPAQFAVETRPPEVVHRQEPTDIPTTTQANHQDSQNSRPLLQDIYSPRPTVLVLEEQSGWGGRYRHAARGAWYDAIHKSDSEVVLRFHSAVKIEYLGARRSPTDRAFHTQGSYQSDKLPIYDLIKTHFENVYVETGKLRSDGVLTNSCPYYPAYQTVSIQAIKEISSHRDNSFEHKMITRFI